jgi:TPR repeat protein
LGYIYFDGEAGIKADQIQACALFKLAALAGSREAARVLGESVPGVVQST